MAISSEENRKELVIAFLICRVKLCELFLGVFTQSIKPEEIPTRLSVILKNLSNSVNECCELKDVPDE